MVGNGTQFVFTMTERADQLHHDNAPAHSAALVQAFSAKHHITQVCQTPPPLTYLLHGAESFLRS